MERAKKNEEGKVKFRKIGAGSLRLPNMRYIRSGDVFEAYPDEIPLAFRDVIIPLEPLPVVEVVKEEVITKLAEESVEYTLSPRGGGWFDVVDKEGKPINEKALKEVVAKELIESLS